MDLVSIILPIIASITRLIGDYTEDDGAKNALAILSAGLETGAVSLDEILELRERIRDEVVDAEDLITELDARLEAASARIRAVDLG
jgi:hypothetical protein